QKFPHGCSEQISSAAFARLVLADEADFGLSRAEVEKQLEKVYSTLRRRQNDQGAFGYWSSADTGNDFVSVYATHLLSEAKAAGFSPPPDLLKNALRNLQTLVAREPRDLADARTVAYAIYVLSREGFITTNYILNLTDYLDRRYEKKWPNDSLRVYLAGAWSILKKENAARDLITGYRMGEHDRETLCDFYQPLGADSQYLAIVARHFPDLLKRISAEDLDTIFKPISEGQFNTLSAAYTIWALKNYSEHIAKNPPELGIAMLDNDKHETQLSLGGQLVRRANFSPNAAGLRFSAKNPPVGFGLFYQIVEAGFDRALPTVPITRGLEVYREFIGGDGEVTQTAQLGRPLTVRINCRALDRRTVSNVAVIDLLPGGFEIVSGSLPTNCDYVDAREDRAVFYTQIDSVTRTISYQIKATNRGKFAIPPPYAESMYDRTIQARGVAGKITVVEAK
ncbi:MAG: alpha-2-macroglobulin family protein, partial [Chthoniobacterales bacterium]